MLAGFAAMAVLFSTSHDALSETNAFARRGRALVTGMCANCHAVGKHDTSPHISAPPFRHLERHMDLGELVARLRRGPIAGHEDMPVFRFARDEAQAIVAYLRSIQEP